MTLAVLVAISIMWIPLAIFFMGKGEPKGTGAATGFVGAVVVIGAILQAAVFKEPFVAGLLFVHGLLYLTTAYALLAGLEDLRSVGNVSLTVAIVSLIYMIIFFTGGPVMADGKQLVAKSDYFALACLGYAVLTIEVWLLTYGKFPSVGFACSLIVWAVVGLWIPAFWLMVSGTLPF